MSTATPPETDVTILREFAATDAGKAIVARRHQAVAAERIRLNDELARVAAEETPAVLRAAAATSDAASAVLTADRALSVAKGAHGDAYAAEMGVRASFTRRRAQLEAQLQDLADPLITEFMQEMCSAHDKARLAVRESESIRTHPVTRFRNIVPATNVASVQARVSAIARAMEAANALRSAPLSHDEIAERLATLRAGLPAIDMGLEEA